MWNDSQVAEAQLDKLKDRLPSVPLQFETETHLGDAFESNSFPNYQNYPEPNLNALDCLTSQKNLDPRFSEDDLPRRVPGLNFNQRFVQSNSFQDPGHFIVPDDHLMDNSNSCSGMVIDEHDPQRNNRSAIWDDGFQQSSTETSHDNFQYNYASRSLNDDFHHSHFKQGSTSIAFDDTTQQSTSRPMDGDFRQTTARSMNEEFYRSYLRDPESQEDSTSHVTSVGTRNPCEGDSTRRRNFSSTDCQRTSVDNRRGILKAVSDLRILYQFFKIISL